MCGTTLVETRSIGAEQDLFLNNTQTITAAQNKQPPLVVEPQATRTPLRVSHTVVVKPEFRRSKTEVFREPGSYWEDKGWLRSGDTYVGYFGTNGRRFPGVITWHGNGLDKCFIRNPPQELWGHEHASCFCYMGDDTYAVHFSRCPQNVDGTIMSVERVLEEAIGGKS